MIFCWSPEKNHFENDDIITEKIVENVLLHFDDVKGVFFAVSRDRCSTTQIRGADYDLTIHKDVQPVSNRQIFWYLLD